MLIYKNNPTLPQGGPDIGLKVGILAEIDNMLHECALVTDDAGGTKTWSNTDDETKLGIVINPSSRAKT